MTVISEKGILKTQRQQFGPEGRSLVAKVKEEVVSPINTQRIPRTLGTLMHIVLT